MAIANVRTSFCSCILQKFIFKTVCSSQRCYKMISVLFLVMSFRGLGDFVTSQDVWEKVNCNQEFVPDNCDFNEIPLLTVEDYERCGPAMLDISARNYFLGVAGRGVSFKDNKAAYKRIRIVPKMLRDVSENSLNVETLGQKMSFPIGLSPVALQGLAHPEGEKATIRAISDMGTVMILSAYSSTQLEEIAKIAEGGRSHLWMQTYIFVNRSFTEFLVRKAERAGFRAIVVTVDSPIPGTLSCDARGGLEMEDTSVVNLPGLTDLMTAADNSLTFKDLAWLRRITRLPIIAKGILSASDAVQAVLAGVSGILVSNHGGRQMDSVPASIDVLPSIVDVVNKLIPRVDVYVDGGVRNGWDVYKAIASGAKMAFIGRPIIWGLSKAGDQGVRDVVNILRKEFQEAMLLSGASNPGKITRDTLVRDRSRCR